MYKLGTRVVPSISSIEHFNRHSWSSPYLEGIIDVSFIQLTPGTRDGFIYDDAYEGFLFSLQLVEAIITQDDKECRAECIGAAGLV